MRRERPRPRQFTRPYAGALGAGLHVTPLGSGAHGSAMHTDKCEQRVFVVWQCRAWYAPSTTSSYFQTACREAVASLGQTGSKQKLAFQHVVHGGGIAKRQHLRPPMGPKQLTAHAHAAAAECVAFTPPRSTYSPERREKHHSDAYLEVCKRSNAKVGVVYAYADVCKLES